MSIEPHRESWHTMRSRYLHHPLTFKMVLFPKSRTRLALAAPAWSTGETSALVCQ